MCGIAGWFSESPLEGDAEDRLQKMMAAVSHRGPDDSGRHCDGHAALGHMRLSIIDLDSGHQPMTSSTGDTTIVFNGEIYNYETLRANCEKAGYVFRTDSDTEVILALFEAHGVAAMSRLRGMYAFALWDRTLNQGWLVRDPLGIKPLFYATDGSGRLLFGSETKAIFASGYLGPSLDSGSLHLLMNFRYVPGTTSLFEGVRQVGAGAALRWDLRGDVEQVAIPGEPHTESETTITAIGDSVAHHLVSDVEVGAYLSGGIDSATIVALARDRYASPMRTFTLAVGDDPMESRHAARTAEILGVRNTLGQDNPDIESALRTLLWHLEVPKINAYQIFELAGFASREVKVCLSGLGGDELFLGYNAHGIMNRARQVGRALPGVVSGAFGGLFSALARGASRAPWSENERAALMLQSLGNWPRVYGLLRNVWDSPGLRAQIYGPRMLDAELPNAFDYIAANWPADPDPVMAMAAYEKREKMVNDLLWQEDRLSMAHGLEVRVPFVDRDLNAHAEEMSRDDLMPGGALKGHLKREVAALLAPEILKRPKSGFQVDAAQFYRQHLQALAREYLAPQRVRDVGLFNPEFVARIDQLPARTHYRWHFFMLYMMIMTHLWIEVFDTQ